MNVKALSPSANPIDHLLRADRMPHIWCPGCGIGTVLKAMLDAIVESAIPEDDLAVVSGIGCTARVPGYLRLDSFHTTHGRALCTYRVRSNRICNVATHGRGNGS